MDSNEGKQFILIGWIVLLILFGLIRVCCNNINTIDIEHTIEDSTIEDSTIKEEEVIPYDIEEPN